MVTPRGASATELGCGTLCNCPYYESQHIACVQSAGIYYIRANF